MEEERESDERDGEEHGDNQKTNGRGKGGRQTDGDGGANKRLKTDDVRCNFCEKKFKTGFPYGPHTTDYHKH